MKNFIPGFILALSLFCGSCKEQSDNSTVAIVSSNSIGNNAKPIKEDSIRKAKLDQLLFSRFRCYVVRQSLLDAGKLSHEEDCCACKTEPQEKAVSETVISVNLTRTTELENKLTALDPSKLAIVSDVNDTAFILFWTDRIFTLQPLAEFKSNRDSVQERDPKIPFAEFQDSLEKWLLADYPALHTRAKSRADSIIENMQAENKIVDPIAEVPVQDDSEPIPYWPLLAGISCAMSLITLIMMFDRKRAPLKAKRDSMQNNKSQSSDIEQRIKSIDASVKDIEREIRELSAWKAGISEKKKSETTSSFVPASYATDVVPMEIIKPAPTLKLLFFSSPNSNGSFQNSSGRNEAVPGASIYRFELQNETTAIFTALDSADAANLALGTPENALKPACEYATIPARVEHIVTEQPGAASLEGTTWRVTRKAKISFR